MNSFSKFKDKFLNNLKTLYDLRLDNVKFHWNIKLEAMCQQKKDITHKDATLTLPNSNHPFYLIKVFSEMVKAAFYTERSTKENWILFQIFAIPYN